MVRCVICIEEELLEGEGVVLVSQNPKICDTIKVLDGVTTFKRVCVLYCFVIMCSTKGRMMMR